MLRRELVATFVATAILWPGLAPADDAMAPTVEKTSFQVPEGLTEMRRKIVEAALSQVGTISSHPSKTKELKGERYGWERLADYVKAALSWENIPADWMKKIRSIQVPDKKMHPANNWCGFFATWAWRQAGVAKAVWKLDGSALQKSVGKPRRDFENMKAGDIALFALRSHHAIVAKVEGKKVHTIDGNAMWGEVNVHDRELGKAQQRIIAYHSLDGVVPAAEQGAVAAAAPAAAAPAPAPESKSPAPAATAAAAPESKSPAPAATAAAAPESKSSSPAAPAPAAPEADGDEMSPQTELPKQCPAVCTTPIGKVTPPGEAPQMSELRAKIIAAAASQIGKVVSCPGDDRKKFGWQNLNSFYKRSMGAGYKALILPHLQKVKSGKWPGPWSWCGIFATWAINKAGVAGAGWGMCKSGGCAKGLEGPLPRRKDSNIQPGDMVIFEGALNHHAVVERVVGDQIYTIDGNQMCEGIYRNVRPLKKVVYFYRSAKD